MLFRALALAVIVPTLFSSGPPQASEQPGLVVSTPWLATHLSDPAVVVITTGDEAVYHRGHIPGARFLDHEATLGAGHRLAEPAALAAAFARAGARDDARIVLYGESAMTSGWLFMALSSLGHADHVSMLDGNLDAWRAEGRPVSTASPPAPIGRLTPRPVSDVIVDAEWVRGRLETPATRLLDVRTERERANGYLPGSTLVLWQELFADPSRLRFKSRDEIRALFSRAGVKPDDQVVTYCAVGMRASLMYFAARVAGLPARVYVGSFEDWRNQAGFPIVR